VAEGSFQASVDGAFAFFEAGYDITTPIKDVNVGDDRRRRTLDDLRH
jgi:hypothetical protein